MKNVNNLRIVLGVAILVGSLLLCISKLSDKEPETTLTPTPTPTTTLTGAAMDTLENIYTIHLDAIQVNVKTPDDATACEVSGKSVTFQTEKGGTSVDLVLADNDTLIRSIADAYNVEYVDKEDYSYCKVNDTLCYIQKVLDNGYSILVVSTDTLKNSLTLLEGDE